MLRAIGSPFNSETILHAVPCYVNLIIPTINPGLGNVFGQLNLNGNLNLQGTVELTVGGVGNGNRDFLQVNGSASLSGGRIQVDFTNGFVPSPGQVIPLLSANQFSGTPSINFSQQPTIPYRFENGNLIFGSTPQTVYVDFGSDPNAVFRNGRLISQTYNKPDAGLSADQIRTVIATDNFIYNNYSVNFTSTRPSSGNYSTVYVGGASDLLSSTLTSLLKIDAGTLGYAQSVNYENLDQNDSAVVFSGRLLQSSPAFADSVAQVIAHETGHLLGLAHLVDDTQHDLLMYPYADPKRIVIGGPEPLGQIDPTTGNVNPIGGVQDSDRLLICYVGSSVGKTAACDGLLTHLLSVIDNGLFSTIYDAKLVLWGGDTDVGFSTIPLGTLQFGAANFILLPDGLNGLRGFIEGASVPDGSIDLFTGPANAFSGDPSNFMTFSQPLFDSDGNLVFSDLSLFQLQTGQPLALVGDLSVLETASVPEPSSVLLLMISLTMLICVRSFGSR